MTAKKVPLIDSVSRFASDINEAIDMRQDSLVQVLYDLLYLGHRIKHKHKFVSQFARENTRDVISLNVNETLMAMKRSTL